MVGIADFLDSLIGGFDLILFIGNRQPVLGAFCFTSVEKQDGYNAVLLQNHHPSYKGVFGWLPPLFKSFLNLVDRVLSAGRFPIRRNHAIYRRHSTHDLTVFLAGYCYHIRAKTLFRKRHWITPHRSLADDYFARAGWYAGPFENQLY
jgi:putative copper resistance protein D